MSSSQGVPSRWEERLIDRGFTRPDGGPNVSALARAMGVSIETARRLVNGIGKPDPETVAAAARVLGSDIQDWVGRHVELGPYEPPAESAMLSERQRTALTELIRSIVDMSGAKQVDLMWRVDPPSLPTVAPDAATSYDDEAGER